MADEIYGFDKQTMERVVRQLRKTEREEPTNSLTPPTSLDKDGERETGLVGQLQEDIAPISINQNTGDITLNEGLCKIYPTASDSQGRTVLLNTPQYRYVKNLGGGIARSGDLVTIHREHRGGWLYFTQLGAPVLFELTSVLYLGGAATADVLGWDRDSATYQSIGVEIIVGDPTVKAGYKFGGPVGFRGAAQPMSSGAPGVYEILWLERYARFVWGATSTQIISNPQNQNYTSTSNTSAIIQSGYSDGVDPALNGTIKVVDDTGCYDELPASSNVVGALNDVLSSANGWSPLIYTIIDGCPECEKQEVYVKADSNRIGDYLVENRWKITFPPTGCPVIEPASPLYTYLCCGSGSGTGGGDISECKPVCAMEIGGVAATSTTKAGAIALCPSWEFESSQGNPQSIWYAEVDSVTYIVWYEPPAPADEQCLNGTVYIFDCSAEDDNPQQENSGCCDSSWSENEDGTFTWTNGIQDVVVEACVDSDCDCDNPPQTIESIDLRDATFTAYSESGVPDITTIGAWTSSFTPGSSINDTVWHCDTGTYEMWVWLAEDCGAGSDEWCIHSYGYDSEGDGVLDATTSTCDESYDDVTGAWAVNADLGDGSLGGTFVGTDCTTADSVNCPTKTITGTVQVSNDGGSTWFDMTRGPITQPTLGALYDDCGNTPATAADYHGATEHWYYEGFTDDIVSIGMYDPPDDENNYDFFAHEFHNSDTNNGSCDTYPWGCEDVTCSNNKHFYNGGTYQFRWGSC